MRKDESISQERGTPKFQSLQDVLASLEALSRVEQIAVLKAVVAFLDLKPAELGLQGQYEPDGGTTSLTSSVAEPKFGEDRTISPKEFLHEKLPQTDVERVACLAYYLTHFRDMPHFKTLDLSKLNTEAAQIKFSNPTVAVQNATQQHYLTTASRGNKQLSAAGEQFVQSLPDRSAAKAAMTKVRRPRRRLRPKAESAPSNDKL